MRATSLARSRASGACHRPRANSAPQKNAAKGAREERATHPHRDVALATTPLRHHHHLLPQPQPLCPLPAVRTLLPLLRPRTLAPHLSSVRRAARAPRPPGASLSLSLGRPLKVALPLVRAVPLRPPLFCCFALCALFLRVVRARRGVEGEDEEAK